MKFEHTIVSNFEGAFRGLRNPLESWDKSDSHFGIGNNTYNTDAFDVAYEYCKYNNIFPENDNYAEEESKYEEWLMENGVLNGGDHWNIFEYAYIGPNDLDLAHRMIKAGTSDSKFLRQINVSVDITAPLYWY